MPQIKMRGIKLEQVKNASKEMIDSLENIIKCPRDYFTVEHIPSTFVMDGNVVDGYPFIEVLWFDRGQEVQDEVAKKITRIMRKQGCNDMDIIFYALKKDKYYENGEHF
ncbi:DUF1904 domain-containing protein [Clostridium aestuarii]|uniref:DUF1904 domain-containing protein n=1 Tax=Clostridium aestuarii TaxID=338193 RepID=A0ABT4D117_9CLOT|nr:DUF1904 domain-containing protein [Clostridium aestuarii]MCY6484937.1 DUF1904 domain-containing protein [Clostridium aestuarii]